MEEFTFGELLKGFRKRADITQQELANDLGVHVQTIKGWERGRHPQFKENVLRLKDPLRLNTKEIDHLLIAADYQPQFAFPDDTKNNGDKREDRNNKFLEDLGNKLALETLSMVFAHSSHPIVKEFHRIRE
ncbi:MAG TPA: helix-turn-helix transcriptional regulator, partial [Anaerovoracaceae bacterium]|nr:helix-turn-helix transcriptional regulator [Anaerovoracaceae bacterium]